jgi:very-short-patch-repair endonuclease
MAVTLSAATELHLGPFTVDQARQIGVGWKTLQKEQWIRLSRGQYAWSGLPLNVLLKLRAVMARIPVRFAFSGPTAGWLRGMNLAPCNPIEVTIDREMSLRARAGVRVRRAALPETDVTMHRGFPTTSALRTVRDLGSVRDLAEGVIAIDMALHAGLVDMPTLSRFVQTNPGTKGIKRLRNAVGLADTGAASPMETRLRLALINAKLPRPVTQAELTDSSGRFIARVDLYYPDCRMVIEYDGENHKERIPEDLRRQNALVNADYHVLRFTAIDIREGTAAVQVQKARNLLARSVR